MAEMLLKPYELSVWEEELDDNEEYYKENKIAVIASNTLDIPEAAHSLILHKNVNGETTLTFSIQYRYFDPVSEEMVVNPFAQYLINERKIKLKYDDQWYDFIIRNHVESTDGMTWSITAEDAFVLELSKNGYAVELNSELNNNLGTAAELAEEALKDTDWQVRSDNLIQTIEEPLWTITTTAAFNVKKIEKITNEEGKSEIVESDATVGEEEETLYVFYSYIVNREKKFLQFIRESDRDSFTYDDKNIISAPNYRLEQDVTYIENQGIATGIELNGNQIMSIGSIYTEHHGYRFVYNQIMKYDPAAKQLVDLYHIDYEGGERQEVYHYNNYDYTTSNVVMSYVTNGDNFNTFENGSLQGWESGRTTSTNLIPLNLVTYPKIDKDVKLSTLSNYAQIRGFLETKFDTLYDPTKCDDVIFNSGIEDNAQLVNYISRGQQYVLRLRYGWSAEQHGDIIPATASNGLRAVVAKYDIDEFVASDGNTYFVKKIVPSSVILDFNGTFTERNNYINTGNFNGDHTQYLIDGVPQEPSTKYCYVGQGSADSYVWDAEHKSFVLKSSSDPVALNFLNYYYTTATAEKSVSNKELSEPTTKIGIFLYINDNSLLNKYLYIEDVQLTPYVVDSNNEIVTIGNVPTAAVSTTDCFYLKPKENAEAADLEIFNSKADLARSLGILESDIQPTYNDDSEKILTVEESHSNCFNILQTIAETFECWVRLEAEHDERGALVLDDTTHKPQKYVVLNEFSGKDNYAGFKYGINLQSIERTIDSAEVVTKLLVDPIQSEYVDNGIVTIQDAKSNPSGESYILNLDYFCKQGLIKNPESCMNDLSDFYAQIKAFNILLNEEEQKRINLEAALVEIGSRRNVYTNLINEAKEDYNKTLIEFKDATGMSYEDYINNAETIAEESGDSSDVTSWLKIDTIVGLVTTIYQDAVIINDYSGLATNAEAEYKKLRLQCYGTEDYSFTVSRTSTNIPGGASVQNSTITLSDYVIPFAGKFYTSQGTEVPFVASLNEKSFEQVVDMPGGEPFTRIDITLIPPNYQIQYGDNDPVPASQIDSNNPYHIYLLPFDPSQNIFVLRNYKLEPIVEQQGCVDRIKELEWQKKEIEKTFYSKYSRFIQEGQWSSQDYVDPNLYYLDALQVSHDYAEPKVSYSINVVDVSEIEDLQNYIFEIGDKTYIEDTEFFGWIENEQGIKTPAKEEVIVTEAEWHLDNPVENVITVQNYRTEFEDLFQRLNATVQTVQYNENSYAKTSSILNAGGVINQELLLSSLNGISGREYNLTSDGTIISDSEGILIRDLTNPRNLMRLSSGGLKISNDAGTTWRTAVDGQGINIGNVYTGVLNTQQVIIQDGNAPSFRWDKSGLSAFKQNENPAEGEPDYDLRKYVRLDQYGFYGVDSTLSEDYTMRSLADVKNKARFGLTWDGFFIKSSYTNGYVSISSNNDFQVMRTEGSGDQKVEYERIKIGALEWMVKTTDEEVDNTKTYYKIEGGNYVVVSSPINSELENYYEKTTEPQTDVAPSLYGIRIKNDEGVEVMKTDSEGNLRIVGTIDALAANFSQMVTVGKNDTTTPNWIEIDGVNSLIQTSDYSPGAGHGWMINKDGDAVFNNITARGAIKTAVFEYAEIQAVGGVFLFRPSSTIRSAAVSGNDLIVTVEKPALFTDGDWCKVSNYTTDGSEPDPTSQITNNGLAHVYQISRTSGSNNITLIGAAAMVDETNGVASLQELEGGALVNMGKDPRDAGYENGKHNYGIGINSSDNTVNLPARSISLFETTINTDPQSSIKVTYDYKDVLGTLPELDHRISEQDTSSHKVSYLYDQYFKGKQGLYTDNIYLGNDEYYLAYYTTNNNTKHLRIEAGNLRVDDTGAYINGTVEAKTGKIGEFILDNPGSSGYANRLYTTGYLPFNNIINTYYNGTSAILNGIYISTSTPMVDLNKDLQGNYYIERIYDVSDNISDTEFVYPKGETALSDDWLYEEQNGSYVVITPVEGISYELLEAWNVDGEVVYPAGTDFKWVLANLNYVELENVEKRGIPNTSNSYGVIAGGNITQMDLTKKEIESGINTNAYAPAWYFRSDGEARIGSIRLSNTGEISMPTLSSMTVDLGVMESGVIKHDPVGYENGLWLSAAENIKAEYIHNPPNSTIDYEDKYEDDGGIRIGDSIYRNDWRLILSDQFGITKEGQLYAADVSIQNLALNKEAKIMLTTDTLNTIVNQTISTTTHDDGYYTQLSYGQQISNNTIRVTVDYDDSNQYMLGRQIENDVVPVYINFVQTKNVTTTDSSGTAIGTIGTGDDGSSLVPSIIRVTFENTKYTCEPRALDNDEYNYGAPILSATTTMPLVIDWSTGYNFAILQRSNGTMYLITQTADTYSIGIESPQRTYLNKTITAEAYNIYNPYINNTSIRTYTYSNNRTYERLKYMNPAMSLNNIRVTFTPSGEATTVKTCSRQRIGERNYYYYGATMDYSTSYGPYVTNWSEYPFAILVDGYYIYLYTSTSGLYTVKIEEAITYGKTEEPTGYDAANAATLNTVFDGTTYNLRLMSTSEEGNTYGDTTFTEAPFYFIAQPQKMVIYTKVSGNHTMSIKTPDDLYATITYPLYIYGPPYTVDPETGQRVIDWTKCPFYIISNYENESFLYTQTQSTHHYKIELLIPDADEDDDQKFIETIRNLGWTECLETDEQTLKNVAYVRTYLMLKPYLKRAIRWG